MCGIIGYVGNKNTVSIIIDCLKNLEYRGYDSAGLSVIDKNNKSLLLERTKGKVSNLDFLHDNGWESTIGIGHTRWATHGMPSEENAHPHTDCTGRLVLVHNGIVENYLPLKDLLIKEGHIFKSETDTEVLVHLIEKYYKGNLVEAVRSALHIVEGAYAIGVMHADHEDELVVAKNQSPLIIGIGDKENFVASDVPAILKYTKDIIYLEDNEIAVIKKDTIIIKNFLGEHISRDSVKVTWDHEMSQKNGYDHFMLKEIFEQPRAIQETIKGRISEDTGRVYIKEMGLSDDEIRAIKKIIIVSCGTSWHSGLIGRIFIEKFTGIPVSVEYAAEFRYTEPIVDKDTLTIGISQSGETADTLAAIREAKLRGSKVVSICNVIGSSIARESDGVIYTHAGPEIGVASTKAFTSQISVLYLFAICVGRIRRKVLVPEAIKYMEALKLIHETMLDLLDMAPDIKILAEKFYAKKNFLYLGRGLGFAVALEGALKLKEISYIHAEGYHAGEMKHGPIALIDKHMPVVVLALKCRRYSKIINNIEEVKAREGVVIAIATEGDEDIKRLADHVIYIPDVDEFLSPIAAVIPLQFLAYYIAVRRGCDVDRPRNLAKSVTVE
ncbi:glutamine--fructose-6-phosphate transaminase (isomerizing) [bacterium]|nr:glutamine--fructose-6-phosphate transaminase (isomerizing) [bacterium]